LNPGHGGFDGPLFVDNTMNDKPLLTDPNLAYAVQMVHATCCLAGSASYLADIREDLRDHGIIRAVRDHDTPALFDWLIKTLSYLRYGRRRVHRPARVGALGGGYRRVGGKVIVPEAQWVLAVLRLPVPQGVPYVL
jgi:hypothetical protein